MNKIDYLFWIGIALLLLILILTMLTTSGCAVWERPINPPKDNSPIVKTIASTDWIMTVFIVGAAGCVFAALNGLKVGWLGLASCIFGLIVKMALSITWSYYLAGIALFVGIVVGIYSIFQKNNAVKELITGIQTVKDRYINPKGLEVVNKTLKEAQYTSQSYVAKVKDQLFPKEKK